MDKYNIWNFWAKQYDRLPVLQKVSLKPTRDNIIKEIIPYLSKKQKFTLLDMGCGTAQLLEEIKDQLPEYDIAYTGVDMSERMIATAKSKFKNETFIQSSVDDYSEKNATYDCVVCAHSFPYYPNKPNVIEKFHNMLKPSGILIMAHGSENNLYDKITLKIIKLGAWGGKYPSIKEMSELLKNKFYIKKIFKVNKRFWVTNISFFVCKKV